MAMRLSDINNKTISGTLTDIVLATPEDNAPEKLAERAMIDNYENHEVNRLMNSVGMEALYAKDKVFSLGYIDNQYSVTLIDHANKTKIVDKFDNPDDARAEFKKLSTINPDRDYDADFDQFMLAVEDNKRFHSVS